MDPLLPSHVVILNKESDRSIVPLFWFIPEGIILLGVVWVKHKPGQIKSMKIKTKAYIAKQPLITTVPLYREMSSFKVEESYLKRGCASSRISRLSMQPSIIPATKETKRREYFFPSQ